MALKWIDGAEGWGDATYAARAYQDTASVATAATPRVSPGLRCFSLNGGRMQTPSLGVQNTWIVGMGLRITTVIAVAVKFFSGGTEQCRFEIENSGGFPRWRLVRGTTTIATSPTFALSQWFYFEFKVDVLTAAATYEIRQNEVSILSGSGANLANSGANGADSIGWGYHTGTALFDDIYILDTTGSAPQNTYLGDVVSVHILPTAEGHQIDMTPSTGTDNAALVDDPETAASGADYNSSDTNGHEDYYTFANMPATGLGTIYGIRISGSWAMATTGSRVARYRYYDGVTEFTLGNNISAASTSIVELPQISQTNPNTGVAWTKSEIDAAEFGVEVVS